MLSLRGVAAGMFGAFRLACLDRGGLRYFDASPEGFWHSLYGAAGIIALPHALLLAIRFSGDSDPPDPMLFAGVHSIAYVMAWTIFPLVMFYLSRLIDRQAQFLRYVVAYNWAAVLQNGVYLAIAIAAQIGLIPREPAQFLLLMVFLGVIAYSCVVAHLTLESPLFTVVGIVVLDLTLGIFVQAWTDHLLQ